MKESSGLYWSGKIFLVLALVVFGLTLWSPSPGREAPGSASGLAPWYTARSMAEVTIFPTADADTRGGSGGDQYIRVENMVLDSNTERGFLRFSLASLPAGSSVTSAELRLYLHSALGDSSVSIQLWRVTANWAESTLSWANQPAAVYYTVATVDNTAGWKSWDVTGLVQGWVSVSAPNYGVMLRGPEGTYYYARHFRSREFGADRFAAAWDPRLAVTYTLPPTPTTPLPVTPTVTTTPVPPPPPGGPTYTPTPTLTATSTPTTPPTWTPAPPLAIPTPTPIPATVAQDLFPYRIEVLQALHPRDSGDPDIPLVAEKKTVVRVYVGVLTEAIVGAGYHVDGSLAAYRGGTRLSTCGLVRNSPAVALGTGTDTKRDTLSLTLNFVISRDCPWLLEGEVTFRATVRGPQCATCGGNDTMEKTVQFNKVRPLKLKVYRLEYCPGSSSAGLTPSWTQAYSGWDFVEAAYPAETVSFQAGATISGCFTAFSRDWGDESWEGLNDMLDRFADDHGSSSVDSNLLVVHQDIVGCRGIAKRPGRHAVAGAGCGSSYAHEIGHNFGLKHASNAHNEDEGGDWESWPYPHGGILGYGWDSSRPNKLILPGSAGGWHSHENMSYGGCVSGAPTYGGSTGWYCSGWMSPLNYGRLAVSMKCSDPHHPANWSSQPYNYYGGFGWYGGVFCGIPFLELLSASVAPPVAHGRPEQGLQLMGLPAQSPPPSREASQPPKEREYLLTSGRIYGDGRAEFRPFYRLTMPVGTADEEGQGPYQLELLRRDGRLLFRRNFEPSQLAVHASIPPRYYLEEVLPWHPATGRIVLKEGDRILAERVVSPNPPTVALLSPNGGERWGAEGAFIATWTARDADGDALYYWVQYSADGGRTWETLRRNLQETSFRIDLAELAGSSQALVRVLATDGVNTAIDASDATFIVARKAPQAFITAPEDGSQVVAGEVVLLRGLAIDYEDGTLRGSALAWRSDLDGALGTGSTVVVSTLSVGEHTITFTASDSDGQIGSASVRLIVR